MSGYQPLIPTGTVNLDQDYKNLQNNFNILNTQFGIDHTPFTDTRGFHTVIHLVANSTIAGNLPNNQPIIPPANVGLTGELFTAQINDGINSDEALYYQSGGGRLSQLTRNFAPIANTTGASFLPGGMIIQWGQGITNGTGDATITFSPAFATFYSANLTAIQNVSNRNFIAFTILPTFTTGTVKTLDINGNNLGGVKFLWVAIGK